MKNAPVVAARNIKNAINNGIRGQSTVLSQGALMGSNTRGIPLIMIMGVLTLALTGCGNTSKSESDIPHDSNPVSYTHLTLPTNREV